jgi:hypothetical protein
MSDPSFHVVYASWATLQRDCKQQIALRGLFIKTKESLDQFSRVLLQLTAPSGETFEMLGEVVQSVAGQGLAVQFLPESSNAVLQLLEFCQSHSATNEEKPRSDDPAVSRTAEEEEPAAVPTSLLQQIQQMSVDEKRRSALHGNREMRLLLIRDRNKTIHPFILKNPSITLDEVEQMAKMPGVNPEVLRMIAASAEWTRSATVCRNLVHNPHTPLREALSTLQKLPQSEVRAIAKSSHVRTPIQQAARKMVAS